MDSLRTHLPNLVPSAFVTSGQVNAKHSLLLEARFYYGLTDVFPNHKTDIFSGSNTMSITVTLGYFYRLK